jgi:hypothetical protein
MPRRLEYIILKNIQNTDGENHKDWMIERWKMKDYQKWKNNRVIWIAFESTGNHVIITLSTTINFIVDQEVSKWYGFSLHNYKLKHIDQQTFLCVLQYSSVYAWFHYRVILWGIGKNLAGFIKNLDTWQFGLSFNIIRHVFFCFGQKKFFVGFMNWWKILVLRTFFEGNLVIFWFLLHFENFCKFSIFHGLFSFWSLTLETKLLGKL